jgi:tRNA U34 5-methylaminomethyl-2-thiouridine-forming methyltransferase MnmC
MENEIFLTQDGSHSLRSQHFGVSYHSKYGAVQESRHVFLEAGLYPTLLKKKSVRILELGFGTGLNAFLTLLDTRDKHFRTYYHSVEVQPLDTETVARLNYGQLLAGGQYAADFTRLHQAEWGEEIAFDEEFVLRKTKGDFRQADLGQHYDVIFFDAFAPDAQPELWELSTLGRAYEALAPGGVLVTYCAKGYVKRNLKALGFTVEALPGPPGKREMTRAVKALTPGE